MSAFYSVLKQWVGSQYKLAWYAFSVSCKHVSDQIQKRCQKDVDDYRVMCI